MLCFSMCPEGTSKSMARAVVVFNLSTAAMHKLWYNNVCCKVTVPNWEVH
jgi:hypothetical protein